MEREPDKIALDNDLKELVCDSWEYEQKDIEGRKIIIGIAIMDKKYNSKAMSAIITKLKAYEEFSILVINQHTMLDMPADKWPLCDCLLSFFSAGFPYARAITYCKLRRPIMINDLFYQRLLWDRRAIYTILQKHNIPVAPHIFIERAGHEYANNDESICYTETEKIENLKNDEFYKKKLKDFIVKYDQNQLPKLTDEEMKECSKDSTSVTSDNLIIQADDYIVVNKMKILKPFLEKPINGEDHNIYIYYPLSSGGGSKRLFRKQGNESSKFYLKENCIRNNGSFIYEKFLSNDGFDIKVYTVGINYAHAEARKSPTLDGKVQRQLDGKEIRYPILMSLEEKDIARQITIIFKQQICGFDLLRSNGKSYVCDVNGWSFVKGNEAYYTDCAWEIRKILLSKIGKQHFKKLPPHIYKSESAISTSSTSLLRPITKMENAKLELRSVVAIFRHGDRTPKQKMKLIVTEPEYLIFFKECKKKVSDPYGPIKLKTPKHLQLLLDNTDKLLDGLNLEGHEMDRIGKLSQLKNVLSRGGHFDGINRKVQLKPIKKVEVKGVIEVVEALLILKWGGELTHSGIAQTEQFGKWFRESVYPYSENGGLLRLHSTYRHDLKCYSSDEGRCQLSAAAFLKGMLALEGELSPILTLVATNDSSIKMLDDSEDASSEMKVIKKTLMKMMNSSEPMVNHFSMPVLKQVNPKAANYIRQLENPIKALEDIHSLIRGIVSELEKLLSIKYKSESYLISKPVKEHINSYIELAEFNDCVKPETKSKHIDLDTDLNIVYYDEVSNEVEKQLIELQDEEKEKVCGCGHENLVLMYKRWKKLEKDFYIKKSKNYDSSKIPDVYDCIKYDLIHNPLLINGTKIQLYKKVQVFNSIITPLEYGITEQEKITIGYNIVNNLIIKIKHDLLWWLDSLVRTEFKGFSNEANFSMLDGNKMEGVINSTWRFVKTRLYFTSASHLYSFFNLLCNAMFSLMPLIGQDALGKLQNINELGYLSYIVFRLYEDLNVDPNDPQRFRLQLGISPGSIGDPLLFPTKNDHIIELIPEIDLSNELKNVNITKFLDSL